MKLCTATTIHLFTTPKQLREIANEMERKMEVATLGDSLTAHYFSNPSHDIHIVADQSEFSAYKNNLENQEWL